MLRTCPLIVAAFGAMADLLGGQVMVMFELARWAPIVKASGPRAG